MLTGNHAIIVTLDELEASQIIRELRAIKVNLGINVHLHYPTLVELGHQLKQEILGRGKLD